MSLVVRDASDVLIETYDDISNWAPDATLDHFLRIREAGVDKYVGLTTNALAPNTTNMQVRIGGVDYYVLAKSIITQVTYTRDTSGTLGFTIPSTVSDATYSLTLQGAGGGGQGEGGGGQAVGISRRSDAVNIFHTAAAGSGGYFGGTRTPRTSASVFTGSLVVGGTYRLVVGGPGGGSAGGGSGGNTTWSHNNDRVPCVKNSTRSATISGGAGGTAARGGQGGGSHLQRFVGGLWQNVRTVAGALGGYGTTKVNGPTGLASATCNSGLFSTGTVRVVAYGGAGGGGVDAGPDATAGQGAPACNKPTIYRHLCYGGLDPAGVRVAGSIEFTNFFGPGFVNLGNAAAGSAGVSGNEDGYASITVTF